MPAVSATSSLAPLLLEESGVLSLALFVLPRTSEDGREPPSLEGNSSLEKLKKSRCGGSKDVPEKSKETQ